MDHKPEHTAKASQQFINAKKKKPLLAKSVSWS